MPESDENPKHFNFYKANLPAFAVAMSAVDWFNELRDAEQNIDAAVARCNSIMSALVEKHVPKRVFYESTAASG